MEKGVLILEQNIANAVSIRKTESKQRWRITVLFHSYQFEETFLDVLSTCFLQTIL